MTAPQPVNRLAEETSPYLKQHARNPVDWYPWGPEALERSRQQERPIFLSIGYSACHWCHVMEHESFEDAEIAEVLNRHFVCIKVDREERPDLDQIYMTAVQLLTGQGGWPMSMFLTPDLKPFYGGTYFPPDDRYGRPGFKRVLLALADAWNNRRDDILKQAGEITDHVSRAGLMPKVEGQLRPELLQNAVRMLQRMFDPSHGGFGRAPKFPHAMELKLLLRIWHRFNDGDALRMAQVTFDHMARGGMYDHLGGGFHRYSTDAHWLVPHFEKMLYDNALLTSAYLEGYQAAGDPFYRQIVDDTLQYVVREMTSPEGGFYSTQDADSEGVEGKFFVWSQKEIEDILGKDLAELFAYVYGVTREGNWEGQNILHRSKSDEQDARVLQRDESDLRRQLEQARGMLLAVRNRRIWPGRDEKILTSWNGLMIGSFAQAAQVLDNPAYADAAARAADFLLAKMRSPDGRLYRTYFAGSAPKYNAYLEDYAFTIDGLVSLYEATGQSRWIDSSLQLTQVMVDQFWDESESSFYFTGRDHESLLTRIKDMHDSSIPAGNSMAATALLRLSRLTGRTDLQTKAEATLQSALALMEQSPMAAGQLLIALDFYLGPVKEFAVVSGKDGSGVDKVLRAIHDRFRPNKVIAARVNQDTQGDSVGLLKDKPALEKVATYICENFACQAPLVGVEAVEKALENE